MEEWATWAWSATSEQPDPHPDAFKGGGKGKDGKGKGGGGNKDKCNACQRSGHWARECWFKDCKKRPDGKTIITREDREKFRKAHPAGAFEV